jgi:hypothetical protein
MNLCFVVFLLSNCNSRTNFASASTRIHQKWPISEIFVTRQSRRHLPRPFARLARLADIRQDILPRTRQHSPNAIFEENVTRLAKLARVMSESHEFGTSSLCLVLIQNHSSYNYIKINKINNGTLSNRVSQL